MVLVYIRLRFLFFLDVPRLCSCFQRFLFSDVPVFHCSYFQMFLFLCSCFQMLQISSVPVSRCSCFICSCFHMFFFYSCIRMSFLSVPVFRCSCFQMFLFSSVPDFRYSCFPLFLFLCSCCQNAEARRSRLCWLVLKRLNRGVTSGRRPGIVWSIATFRYALTIWDRTETPGIPRLVP